MIVPDPNYLYMSPKHEEALARLVFGLKKRHAVMLLTGEVGAGKTTLIRYLTARLPASIQTATISNSNLSAEPLLRMILEEFGQPAPRESDKAALIKSLQSYLERKIAQNRRSLLIIDEAQNLPLDALEEIRMLSNFQTKTHSLLQILLVGQPELRTRMRDPRCLQIAQRAALNYHITALNQEETRAYIAYRLKRSGGSPQLFTADAVEMVFRLSRGIPRSINLTCDSALIYGFTEEMRVIDSGVVSKAAKQLDLMGLVRMDDAAGASEAAAPSPGQGNGDGRLVVQSIDDLRKNLDAFMNDLREELRKFGDQANSLNSTAASLNELIGKRLAQPE
jgi:general secretion pathway protein A